MITLLSRGILIVGPWLPSLRIFGGSFSCWEIRCPSYGSSLLTFFFLNQIALWILKLLSVSPGPPPETRVKRLREGQKWPCKGSWARDSLGWALWAHGLSSATSPTGAVVDTSTGADFRTSLHPCESEDSADTGSMASWAFQSPGGDVGGHASNWSLRTSKINSEVSAVVTRGPSRPGSALMGLTQPGFLWRSLWWQIRSQRYSTVPFRSFIFRPPNLLSQTHGGVCRETVGIPLLLVLQMNKGISFCSENVWAPPLTLKATDDWISPLPLGLSRLPKS